MAARLHRCADTAVHVAEDGLEAGDTEKVRALKLIQEGRRVLSLGDGGAERRGQSVEDRRLKEELSDRLGLVIEDLEPEIVDDLAIIAGEGGDEVAPVVAVAQRQ